MSPKALGIPLFLLFAAGASAQTVYRATLNGAQETPPNASPATGTGLFVYDPATSLLSYTVTVAGLSGPVTSAHIHVAPVGSPGGILFSLAGGPVVFSGVSFIDPVTDLPDLQASDFYANIHTTVFPGGEIRGQVTPSDRKFDAFLTGAKEVPATGSAATGTGKFELDAANRIVYSVSTSGIVGTMAHIHLGAVGVNGPIVFPLAGGPSSWSGMTPVLTPLQIAQLQSGLYYVNVHSAAFPGSTVTFSVANGLGMHVNM